MWVFGVDLWASTHGNHRQVRAGFGTGVQSTGARGYGESHRVSAFGLTEAYGSPIFKVVQQKRCTALYTALTKSLESPEYAVGEGSEWSNVEWSVPVPH